MRCRYLGIAFPTRELPYHMTAFAVLARDLRLRSVTAHYHVVGGTSLVIMGTYLLRKTCLYDPEWLGSTRTRTLISSVDAFLRS
jgi:hypothetical protein